MGDFSQPGFMQGFSQTLIQGLQLKQQREQQQAVLDLQKKELKLKEDKAKLDAEKAAAAAARFKAFFERFGQAGGFAGLGGTPGGPQGAPPGAPTEAQAAPGVAPPPDGSPGAMAPPAPATGPVAPQVAGPAAAPMAPPPQLGLRFVPDVSMDASGTLRLNLRGQATTFQLTTVTVTQPDGRVVTVDRVFDPQRGVIVHEQPVGPAAEPEQLRRATEILRGMGIEPTHPLFPTLRGRWLQLEAEPDARTKSVAMQAFTEQVRGLPQQPGAVPGVDLGAARATGEAQEVRQEERKVRARETAQREEGRIAVETSRRLDAFRSMETSLFQARDIFRQRPDLVGKTWLPFKAALKGELATVVGSARRGEYVSGHLASRMRQFLGSADPEEVVFRRAILDAMDQTLRARSGAQINEQEYQRIVRFMFELTDEPNTFGPSLDRMINIVDHDIRRILKTVITSPTQQLHEREAEAARQAPPPRILRIRPLPAPSP